MEVDSRILHSRVKLEKEDFICVWPGKRLAHRDRNIHARICWGEEPPDNQEDTDKQGGEAQHFGVRELRANVETGKADDQGKSDNERQGKDKEAENFMVQVHRLAL